MSHTASGMYDLTSRKGAGKRANDFPILQFIVFNFSVASFSLCVLLLWFCFIFLLLLLLLLHCCTATKCVFGENSRTRAETSTDNDRRAPIYSGFRTKRAKGIMNKLKQVARVNVYEMSQMPFSNIDKEARAHTHTQANSREWEIELGIHIQCENPMVTRFPWALTIVNA